MQSSLENLVSITEEKDLKFTKAHFKKNFHLMSAKGIFPYDYITSFEKLNETSLPPIDAFYNALTDSHITEEQYKHAQNVWEKTNCETLEDYARIYLESDVLLLSDVMENFRDLAMSIYKLDCNNYYTLPGLAYDACLKITKVELELLGNIEDLNFFERALRGGLTQVSHRYAKANNEYMKNYDPKKPDVYLWYLDVNALYAHALSQKLPTGNFKWVTAPESFDIDSVDDKRGYILEVDLSTPREHFDRLKELPLAPEHEIPPGSKLPKLLATFNKKTKYVVHIETLRLYKSLGMKIDKIHRVLGFDHSNWMAPYVQLNAEQREKATTSFAKNFFKLMVNAVFGKTCENIRKHRDIHLVRSWHGTKGARKLVVKPNFKKITIFSENLVAIELKKTEILYDKVLYVGQTVLDLSKKHFYDIYYNKLKPGFGDSLQLCYVDTDSYIMKVTNSNPYQFMKNNPHLFDTSDYPVDNPYGISLANKKKIGLVKDEAAGRQIVEMVALRPKMYAYRFENETPIRKAKGLTKMIVRTLTFEDYKKCLFEGDDYEPVRKKQRNIRSENHVLFTVEENKITLSSKDDKRIIEHDGIKTVPYGYR